MPVTFSSGMLEDLEWFLENTHQFTLDFNPHRTSYHSVEDELALMGVDADEVPRDVLEVMKETNRMVVAQCYPRTPVSFFVVVHHDPLHAVDRLRKVVEEDHEKSSQLMQRVLGQ